MVLSDAACCLYTDDSVLLCAYRRIDALTRDYGVVCHTAEKAYHTVK